MLYTTEIDQVRQTYALAQQLSVSTVPVVQTLGTQILGLCKLLIAEIVPDEFEHIRVSSATDE